MPDFVESVTNPYVLADAVLDDPVVPTALPYIVVDAAKQPFDDTIYIPLLLVPSVTPIAIPLPTMPFKRKSKSGKLNVGFIKAHVFVYNSTIS